SDLLERQNLHTFFAPVGRMDEYVFKRTTTTRAL
ncbi:hypothetical protein ECEC1865_6465, partial [Escherichia coli EC1865]